MMLCFRAELDDGLTIFRVSSMFPINESLIPAGRHAVIIASRPSSHLERIRETKRNVFFVIKHSVSTKFIESVIFTSQTKP